MVKTPLLVQRLPCTVLLPRALSVGLASVRGLRSGFFFFLKIRLVVYGSSQARDQIQCRQILNPQASRALNCCPTQLCQDAANPIVTVGTPGSRYIAFGVTPAAYRNSQVGGPIGATGLCHSHSSLGCELCLGLTPQHMATLDP